MSVVTGSVILKQMLRKKMSDVSVFNKSCFMNILLCNIVYSRSFASMLLLSAFPDRENNLTTLSWISSRFFLI